MSDRCSMQIVCRREDVPVFEQLGFCFESGLVLKRGDLHAPWPDRADSSVVLLGQGEVAYAARVGESKDGFGELSKGLIYYGSHGSGCEYGCGVFATLGKTLDYARTLYGSNWPAVELKPDGSLDRPSLREGRKYLATLGLAKRALITHLRQHTPELCRRRKPATEAKP